MNKLYIIGAGGFGREIAFVAQTMNFWSDYFFIDDNKSRNSLVNEIPIFGTIDDLMKLTGDVFIAIGDNKLRNNIVTKLSSNPKLFFPNIVHPNISWIHSKFNKIGFGNYIGEGVIGTVNISIGNFNMINTGCLLSHDTEIGSFCNLLHGVKITSGATLLNSVFIGAGACIVSNVLIDSAIKINPNQVFRG